MPPVHRSSIRIPILASLLACAACSTPAPSAATALKPRPLLDFVGDHRGTLIVHGSDGPQEVPMRLLVEPVPDTPDRLRWVLHYGDGERAQVRDYVLCIDDAATGRCRIDEQNGIELAARFVDGELVSVFAVQGQTLCCHYRLVPDGVAFALESWGADTGTATGHGVTTFDELAVQRALLRRTGP